MPIDVTELGMDIVLKAVQPIKAESPMLVTDSGILMSASALQPRNIMSAIDETESGSVMPSRFMHIAKAPRPMCVTFPGMSRFSILLHE